jgi:hypothetical protein
MRRGDKAKAIDNLKTAVAIGFPKVVLERNLAFQSLREEPAFKQLMTSESPPSKPPDVNSLKPTLVDSGVALVSATNTAWDPRIGMLRSFFQFPDQAQRSSKVSSNSVAANQLNDWFLRGTAAGNYGDLYDNRDGGHSSLPPEDFPQLARIQYGDEAQRPGLDRGLDRYFLFNAPTIGNASLAITHGPMWRSRPRAALTDPVQVQSLYQEYVANHIYVYPAHEDYGRSHGDLITANTPYMLISGGSSGSDQSLLKAVADILAAFKPEVKAFLIRNGLIAPRCSGSSAGVNSISIATRITQAVARTRAPSTASGSILSK